MPLIYDCFLYNGEDDLLEIRLNYLNNFVDYFVILESCQTFQLQKKKFTLEKNKKLLDKFKKKIIYYQNIFFINNLAEFNLILKKQFPNIEKKLNLLDNYNKNDLTWALDTFHRELIVEPIKNKILDNDIFILSDLDEIPNYNIIKNKTFDFSKINSLKQNQFNYFLNSYSLDNWYGTTISKWKYIKNTSLNSIRYSSKNNNKSINYIPNGGYHFSTIGPLNNIMKKVTQWSHKEYNNFVVKYMMKKRYNKGLDIFFQNNNQLKVLNIKKTSVFDDEIRDLILKKSRIIKNSNFLKKNMLDDLLYLIIKCILILFRLKRNILKN